MARYTVRQFLRDARVSRFEEHLVLTGILLLVAGVVLAFINGTTAGPAWFLGVTGLGMFAVCALSRGVRLYRAGVAASLPRAVGRVGVRIRPHRVATLFTATFALVLPAVATGAFVVLVHWAWMAIAVVLLFGCAGLLAAALRNWENPELAYGQDPPPAVTTLLARLCMRADIPVPELVIDPGLEANAWTTRGRLHLTRPLLKLLGESEIEAVMAHELAHLAHRDSAVMDVCSAPSRVLLRYAGMVASGYRVCLRALLEASVFVPVVAFAFAVVSAVPSFVLGWVSRLSVLGMSRSREYAADAAAATLTGRPSALASALMKLDDEQGWPPRADLREAQARAVLCIVATDRSRLGRLFRTHPPTAARVKRLQAIEQRVQAGGRIMHR